MKLMILDGNSIVNRAYYGIRMLNAPDGRPTNGVYGFLSILQKLLDEETPDSLCVTFDLAAPTFRHLRYEGYKAQRKGMPEELAVQMPVLKQVLDEMGILRLEKEGYEADDLIGTVSRLCSEQGWDCVVVTGDKDSFQLIDGRVTVKHYKSRMGRTEITDYTPARFEEEYGFAPAGIIDLKALMGDSSDNIPGVPGVGEKTAMELMHRFGSLDAVYAGYEESDLKPGVKKKLSEGRESAYLSYELATIDRNVPLTFAPEQAKWDRDFQPGLYELFLRLGFSKFIEQFKLSAPEEAQPEGPVFEGTCSLAELTDAAAVDAAAETLRALGKTAYIWAEPSFDFVLVHVSPSEIEGRAFCLKRETYEGDFDRALGALLAPEIQKVGHNIKDLQRSLLERNLSPEGWVFDTALAAYLLDATAGSYEVPRLCVRWCGFEPWRRKDRAGETQLSLLDEESDDAASAAEEMSEWASLAAALDCLHETLEQKLTELGMHELYYDIELPLCRVLAEMEHEGFLIDREALAAFGESLSDGIAELEKSIYALAGEAFNINSPKQLGHVLFEVLMLPAGKKTKTGWSTNAEVLEKLRGKHPIIQQILDYRMLTKLKSTYADGLLKVISDDGRVHTTFTMTVTDTGRLSSREPNLQNIPIRRELGGEIRKMFVAAPGKTLVDADYSQIELRILSHISGDEAMQRAFLDGEDIHAVTASQVFGVPLDQVTSLQRSHAKAVNFGIVYGISAFSLSQDIHVSVAEAKAYIDAYLEKYHGVRDYMKHIVEQARENGYVSTSFGRRRALPELKSANFNLRSFGERVALNMPIQGTAADVIKLAMVHVFDRLGRECPEAKLILQVHDELIVECPETLVERVKTILTEEMENAVSFSVPLTAEAHSGGSWYDAK